MWCGELVRLIKPSHAVAQGQDAAFHEKHNEVREKRRLQETLIAGMERDNYARQIHVTERGFDT